MIGLTLTDADLVTQAREVREADAGHGPDGSGAGESRSDVQVQGARACAPRCDRPQCTLSLCVAPLSASAPGVKPHAASRFWHTPACPEWKRLTVADFESLKMVGKGAFGEVRRRLPCRSPSLPLSRVYSRLLSLPCTHTHTRARVRAHARTHARTHACTPTTKTHTHANTRTHARTPSPPPRTNAPVALPAALGSGGAQERRSQALCDEDDDQGGDGSLHPSLPSPVPPRPSVCRQAVHLSRLLLRRGCKGVKQCGSNGPAPLCCSPANNRLSVLTSPLCKVPCLSFSLGRVVVGRALVVSLVYIVLGLRVFTRSCIHDTFKSTMCT